MPTLPDNEQVVDSPIAPLPYAILDAAYSTSLERIIIVTASPSPALHIYDPLTKADQTIALSKVPTCLGLSADGKFAAVGHDESVSYVDLQQAKLVKTLDATIHVDTLALAANGWIYVSSSQRQNQTFNAVQIATNNEETLYSVALGGDKLVLGADGLSLFAFQRNISTESFEHLDLQPDGKVSFPNNMLPPSSNREACGDGWPSADQKRVFSRCGNVFRQLSDPKQDLTFNGTLPLVSLVVAATHSLATDTIIALVLPGKPGDPAYKASMIQASPYLYFFDYVGLTPSAQKRLPRIDDAEQSNGRFVFTNAAGTRAYVLVTSAPQMAPDERATLLAPTAISVQAGAPFVSVRRLGQRASLDYQYGVVSVDLPITSSEHLSIPGADPNGPSAIFCSAIVHAPTARVIYALTILDHLSTGNSQMTSSPQKLLIFDADTFKALASLKVPSFTIGAQSIQRHGQYLFVNSQGTQFYAVMQADPGSGLLNDFGIWTGKVEHPTSGP